MAALNTHSVAAEYTDEAVSAFKQDRGPGLAEAMQHVEDLAQELGAAELWAQHSDRLARGDGRSARHAVEIALWALKCDVRVRTVQDPDTFRDLLYAVVTGQRNHEDSRRKSLAVSAGHRRAAERGEHAGARPDGYRVAVDVDADGTITKRLEFDPERRAMIELIFRRALRRQRTGLIARALNDAGWRTKPNRRGTAPRTWTPASVYAVLKSPRYAGLSTYKGEVVGQAKWPAYITERQHKRIKAWLSERRQPERRRSLETYLLAGLARCGYCGGPIQQHTGRKRQDGIWSRRYICASQYRDRSKERCQALRMDADLVEAAFVAAMPALFGDEEPRATTNRVDDERGSEPHMAERQEVIDAARAGDSEAFDHALEQLLARLQPEETLTRQLARTSRRARQNEVIEEFARWAKTGVGDRTEEMRTEARRLNGILLTWLSQVDITIDPHNLRIVVHHRPSGISHARQTAISFARSEWWRYSPLAERPARLYIRWSREDVLSALRRWADQHGHAPRTSDWDRGGFEHPKADTVRRHFGTWQRALKAAGLKPANPRAIKVWRDAEIVRALQAWTARKGRPPRGEDWMLGTIHRPCKTTVYNHFGTWSAALAAARLNK